MKYELISAASRHGSKSLLKEEQNIHAHPSWWFEI
jgi:hypothetical protein